MTSGNLALPYGPGESLTIGDGFDGCMHELIVHARILTDDEVLAMSSYLTGKWMVPATTAPAIAAPPPPLAPYKEELAISLTSWAIAEGSNSSVPAGLAASSDDPGHTACISGYGQLGFNGTTPLDDSLLYVLEFKVAASV